MSAHADHSHHISSPALLISTFVALVALTALTVAQSVYVDLENFPLDFFAPFIFNGPQDLSWLDMPVTLAIATVKAALVAVIFMHLQHDKLFNGLLLIGSVLFLVLFVGMVLLDSNQYQPQIESYLYNAEATAAP